MTVVSGGRLIPGLCSLMVFCLGLFSGSALAQSLYDRSAWENYTNINGIQDMVTSGDTLWLASTGGLVRVTVNSVASPVVLTNADGLGGNDLRWVALDSGGEVWTGGLQGQLSHRLADAVWENFTFELEGMPLELTAAAPGPNGFLWVGSGIGLHKFDTRRHGGEIKETYTRLGGWPASDPVADVVITPGHVWVAGAAGVARADVSDPFLLDFSHWESWSEVPDLNVIVQYRDLVYVGGKSGLWAFADTLSVPGDTSWVRIGFAGYDVTGLFAAGDTLWVATDRGLGYCVGGKCTGAPIPGTQTVPLTSVVQTADGSVWDSPATGGLRRLRDGRSEIIRFPGPLDNTFEDVAVGRDGALWCVHPVKGLDILRDDRWIAPPYFDTLVGAGGPATSVDIAPNGDIWVGAWGAGAFRINPDDPLNDWVRYDTSNSTLGSVESGEPNNYIVVRDVAVDGSGRVWFANAYAASGPSLVYFDHGCWGVFDAGDGLESNDLAALATTGNEVLIGFGNDGLAGLEYNLPLCLNQQPAGTVRSLTYKNTNDGLPSVDVRVVLIDRADSLWVGTNTGLAQWSADIRWFRQVSLPAVAGLTINTLAADVLNTIWVGTDGGLVMVPQSGPPLLFTSRNSPLVGDHVRGIAIDDRAGIVWIGTTSGLSRLSAGVSPAESVDDVLAYPNPFVVESGRTQTIRFNAPSAFDSRVMIFTAAGERVAEVGASAGWDGRNRDGVLVSSGVYLFVVRGPNGEFGRGKIAVINRR